MNRQLLSVEELLERAKNAAQRAIADNLPIDADKRLRDYSLIWGNAAGAAVIDEMAKASTRPWTPSSKTETGSRFTVKRCCNGCHKPLGDVTTDELDLAMLGGELPDVTAECGCVDTPSEVSR